LIYYRTSNEYQWNNKPDSIKNIGGLQAIISGFENA